MRVSPHVAKGNPRHISPPKRAPEYSSNAVSSLHVHSCDSDAILMGDDNHRLDFSWPHLVTTNGMQYRTFSTIIAAHVEHHSNNNLPVHQYTPSHLTPTRPLPLASTIRLRQCRATPRAARQNHQNNRGFGDRRGQRLLNMNDLSLTRLFGSVFLRHVITHHVSSVQRCVLPVCITYDTDHAIFIISPIFCIPTVIALTATICPLGRTYGAYYHLKRPLSTVRVRAALLSIA